MIIYWTFMVYIAIVGFGSIIPQVFWPETADADDTIACDAHVAELEHELLHFASTQTMRPTLQNGPLVEWSDDPVRDEIGIWFRDWDTRFLPEYARCGENAKQLFQLRHRLETSIRRYAREEGPRIQHASPEHPPATSEGTP